MAPCVVFRCAAFISLATAVATTACADSNRPKQMASKEAAFMAKHKDYSPCDNGGEDVKPRSSERAGCYQQGGPALLEQQDCNRGGSHDLGSFGGIFQPEVCEAKCLENYACMAWSYVADRQMCYLKNACTTKTHDSNLLSCIMAPLGPTYPLGNCSDDPTETYCSPEICNITEENTIVNLDAKTYYLNKQIFLPSGTRIVGKGKGKTLIKACGPPVTFDGKPLPDGSPTQHMHDCICNKDCGRGFLLNSNTYIGHFTFQGRDQSRWWGDGAEEVAQQMGSSPIETPGCLQRYCAPQCAAISDPKEASKCMETPMCKYQTHAGVWHNDACTANNCSGIRGAVAEEIQVVPWTTNGVVWVPATKGDGNADIIFRGIESQGAWRDYLNLRGPSSNILVENCTSAWAADDTFAVWGGNRPGKNITFRNNIAIGPRYKGYGAFQYPEKLPATVSPACTGNVCFAVYGGESATWENNTCIGGSDSFVRFHNSFAAVYPVGNDFALRGNIISSGGFQNCANGGPMCSWDGGVHVNTAGC